MSRKKEVPWLLNVIKDNLNKKRKKKEKEKKENWADLTKKNSKLLWNISFNFSEWQSTTN